MFAGVCRNHLALPGEREVWILAKAEQKIRILFKSNSNWLGAAYAEEASFGQEGGGGLRSWVSWYNSGEPTGSWEVRSRAQLPDEDPVYCRG